MSGSATTDTIVGRVMIVDDDPIVSGMLGVTLESAGHSVAEMESGDAALASLAARPADALPEVLFVDIEMPGMNGYALCRQLKADRRYAHIPVVFISSHDTLDDRITAYEAGGDDFVAKPFDAQEAAQKAAICIRHHRKEVHSEVMRKSAESVAMNAITSLGESAIQLKYARRALGCYSLQSLARETVATTAEFGLKGHVQFRTPGQTITLTENGPASPLEESVFDKMLGMGRIFSFKNRMVVNHEKVSILVVNMPLDDAEYCGRIRDHLAIVAEAADLAIDNVCARLEAVRRAQEMQHIAAITRSAVEELRTTYRDIQISARLELETMTDSIEGMYLSLGLTNRQEATVSDVVRHATGRVLDLLELGSTLDASFTRIVGQLAPTDEIPTVEEKADPGFESIELW